MKLSQNRREHRVSSCQGPHFRRNLSAAAASDTRDMGFEIASYLFCNAMNSDVNRDELLNNFDIDPYVVCLVNGVCD